MLVDVEGFDEKGISICPNGSMGETVELGGIVVVLPKAPKVKDILFHDLAVEDQYWRKTDLPQELSRIRSMDEWAEMPKEFRDRFRPYIEEEFRRRRDGVWFYNRGDATYITGRH